MKFLFLFHVRNINIIEILIVTMHRRVCPLCGSPLVRENGLLICSNCGYLVDEELLPGVFDEAHYAKNRFRSIDNIVFRLDLPDEVSKIAKEIVSSYEANSGKRATPSILVASVIIAARSYGISIPIKEVCKRYPRVSPSRLALTIGILEEVLPRRGISWEGYINYLIGKLSKDERIIECLKQSSGKVPHHLIIERLRINSIKEINKVRRSKRSHIAGRNPVYIAAAVIYIVGKKIGIRRLSQGLLADALGANRSTISKALSVVRGGKVELRGG